MAFTLRIRKKSDVRDESERIIQDAIIFDSEKRLTITLSWECDPIEPGCFLWDVVENAINTTENVAFREGFQLAVDAFNR